MRFILFGLFFGAFSFTALFSKLFAVELTAINFFQENEVSRLEMTFDSNAAQAKRFHVVADKQIIVDIPQADASDSVLRGFDTAQFSGSIVYVSPYRRQDKKGDLRITLQLRDNVRSLLEQNGSKMTLFVENRFGVFSKERMENATQMEGRTKGITGTGLNEPKSDSIEDILDNITQSGPKKYVGKKISINVRELGLANILKMIADSSGFNIIMSEQTMKRPVMNLTLTNAPWDQALDTILLLGKLVASKNGNILIVKTLEETTEDRKAEEDARQMNIIKQPLVTKIFPISYADIKELQELLKPYLTKDRGSISIENRTNSIIVKDAVDVIDRIRKLVEELDTQTPQILIEAKIVEASEGFTKDIGLKEGLKFQYDPITSSADIATAVAPISPAGFQFNSAAISNGVSGTFAGFTINAFKRLLNLDLKLQLMEEESKGKIISSPKVITQNKKTANIGSTTTTNYQTSTVTTTGTQYSYQPISADLTLAVTPYVTNEGSIAMSIDLKKGDFTKTYTNGAPPDMVQRTLKTDVLVANGETIVIGGVYTFHRTESSTGVPFLQDIPLLGWLFRTSYNPKEEKNELIIFLTPRIINQEEAGFVEKEGDLS